MKHRKPDILVVLIFSVAVGVLVTGYAQKMMKNEPPLPLEKERIAEVFRAGHGHHPAAATVENSAQTMKDDLEREN